MYSCKHNFIRENNIYSENITNIHDDTEAIHDCAKLCITRRSETW